MKRLNCFNALFVFLLFTACATTSSDVKSKEAVSAPSTGSTNNLQPGYPSMGGDTNSQGNNADMQQNMQMEMMQQMQQNMMGGMPSGGGGMPTGGGGMPGGGMPR